jgi:hypothetical protein
MHTLLSVHSFIRPFFLLRSVTLCSPSSTKSDKATINIERTQLDADYVNLHASTRKIGRRLSGGVCLLSCADGRGE